jgi:hypothetical protein
MRKSLFSIISVLLVVAGLGCASLSYLATPADIDKNAVNYAADAGACDANDYKGYGNLDKASRLRKDVDQAHILNQEELQQALDRDNTQHAIHSGTTATNERAALEREEAIFGEGGLLTLGLTMAGMGGLGGVIGTFRKRPGDMTPEDHEKLLTAATGKTAEELSAKEKQLLQVVKGVKIFLDAKKAEGDNVLALREALSTATDDDTKVAVAGVKATL